MSASVYIPYLHRNHQSPPKVTRRQPADYGRRKGDKRRRRKFFGE